MLQVIHLVAKSRRSQNSTKIRATIKQQHVKLWTQRRDYIKILA